MKTESNIKSARARSVSHTEIVRVAGSARCSHEAGLIMSAAATRKLSAADLERVRQIARETGCLAQGVPSITVLLLRLASGEIEVRPRHRPRGTFSATQTKKNNPGRANDRHN